MAPRKKQPIVEEQKDTAQGKREMSHAERAVPIAVDITRIVNGNERDSDFGALRGCLFGTPIAVLFWSCIIVALVVLLWW